MRSVLHICIHHRCFDEVGVTHMFSFLCVVIFFVVVCRRHMSGVYNVASFHLASIKHPVHSLTLSICPNNVASVHLTSKHPVYSLIYLPKQCSQCPFNV